MEKKQEERIRSGAKGEGPGVRGELRRGAGLGRENLGGCEIVSVKDG